MKHMELLRRKLVYELFIEQFVAMSLTSIKYRSLEQTLSLLKQAERLCHLLIDDKFIEEAEKHLDAIVTLRNEVQILLKTTVEGPELPRRDSNADKQAIRARYRPAPTPNLLKIDSASNLEEAASDDDNDEIYNYHKSVTVQIHATSAENLARFQHSDEVDDVEEVTNSVERLELNLKNENFDSEAIC